MKGRLFYEKNKIISVSAIFAIAFTMLAGCEADPVVDDLTNYIKKQMPAITELENSVASEFNSVVGTNYVDDQTQFIKLKDKVIPNSNRLS